MTKPTEQERVEAIELSTKGLRSKGGFSDGDVLEDILWDIDIDEHDVLFALVEKYLRPEIPAEYELIKIVTHHNPVRLVNTDADFDDFSVKVSREKVLEAAVNFSAAELTRLQDRVKELEEALGEIADSCGFDDVKFWAKQALNKGTE